MKTRTFKFVNLIRASDHGSDWYGNCEICNHSMPTAYVHERAEVIIDSETAEKKLKTHGQVYCHSGCAIEAYGDHIEKSTLAKSISGKYCLLPDFAFEGLQ